MEPIRVAQVLHRMESGGIEAVVMNYYRHIDRSQIQLDFHIAQDSSSPQREEVQRLGAGICYIPTYTHFFAYQRTLYQAFKQGKYKIVHAHLSTLSVFSLFAARRAHVPVRICHNHTTANWGEGLRTLLKYILRPFNRIFANRRVARGEMAGRWMYGNHAFDQGKVFVLPNAIDSDKFAYDPVAREKLRKELGILDEHFVVGHVGRFMWQKPFVFD